MKTIKFRAWDKDNKKMINLKNWAVLELNRYNDKFDIMQYTGLKDKNGKDIYEGDIVEFPEYYWWSRGQEWQLTDKKTKSEVFFAEGEWSINDKHSEGRLYQVAGKIEVIGNKFENKNLLKK